MIQGKYLNLITSAVLSLLMGAASAEVSVVKVINFSCQFCKATEVMDAPIKRAVLDAEGKFVYAALPENENSDGSRERVYYALRAANPAAEPQVRASLFKGSQELGYPLATEVQATEWLNTDLVDLGLDWASVASAAKEKAALKAYERAIRITIAGGVQLLPSYLVLKDGVVVRTLDVESSGGSYPALREAVIAAVVKASTTTPLTK
jgi:hypothetical protein